MHYTRFLTGAAALVLGAQGVFGISHGELAEYNGKNIRWHELAKGVFTGVPEDEWDDKHHRKSLVEWDVDEIVANSSASLSSASTGLESRDLAGMCTATKNCLVFGTQWFLLQAYNTWISLAEYAANGTPGKDLMDFLNQPFVANAAGVAVAGVISGKINDATKKECSTAPAPSSQADLLRSAIQVMLDNNPGAQQVVVTVDGPNGSITVTASAGPPNTSPNLTCQNK
ncbi:hypothetical protein NM208_g3656 [Fusarium decemcellulare]|uniref:Uncharacterized protein n=1 Tax=Fusarium decemcellulare TaxID=57161 RepID=A0ACC1SNB7_9HYPO|nr:hypothetical protein NM208_g3656 [Fusarium decemcellulare]